MSAPSSPATTPITLCQSGRKRVREAGRSGLRRAHICCSTSTWQVKSPLSFQKPWPEPFWPVPSIMSRAFITSPFLQQLSLLTPNFVSSVPYQPCRIWHFIQWFFFSVNFCFLQQCCFKAPRGTCQFWFAFVKWLRGREGEAQMKEEGKEKGECVTKNCYIWPEWGKFRFEYSFHLMGSESQHQLLQDCPNHRNVWSQVPVSTGAGNGKRKLCFPNKCLVTRLYNLSLLVSAFEFEKM